jgi:3',5'-cyclic AMP phosphodiesterase CpdA
MPESALKMSESAGADDRTELTFAHITDAHLTSPDGASAGELMNKRILGALSWRRRRRHIHRPSVLSALVTDLAAQAPAHVAITGDLTQIGLPMECQAARAWLDELAPPAGVSLVPGNHDRYARAAWAETVGLWAPYAATDATGRVVTRDPASPDAPEFPAVRVRGPVAFIGVSSSVVSPWFMATGRVGAAQRGHLGRILERAGDAGLFRVLLIHHTPVPGGDKWRKRLTDAGDVARLIGRHGAELVLHGHTHRLQTSRLPGPDGRSVPVVGLSSASADDPRPGREARYSLWTVQHADGGHRLTHRSRVFRDGLFAEGTDWNPLDQ